jgi:hypothetical protein
MSITLGQGFSPYLLQHIKSVAADATPQYKLEVPGFLNLLQSNTKPEILQLNTNDGHKKTAQIRYKQRWTKAHTDTSKSCDQTNVGTRRETSVDLSSTRQFAIHITDETIAKYEQEASKSTAIGKPATGIMNETLEEIMLAASAILDGVNDDLSTIAVSNIGRNRRTGSSASSTINLELDATQNVLTDGMTQILADYKNNGGMGIPKVWGSGLMYNFLIQQASKSFDQSGFNTSVMARGVNFFHDLSASSILGSNQVVVYEPNAIQIVEYLEYTGFKAGQKPGASFFGVMTLPMVSNGEILPVDFDFQLRYNDCQTTLTDAYYGTSLTLEKGYNLIISKQCGIFTIPDDAFRINDELYGNRGSLRYTLTNV